MPYRTVRGRLRSPRFFLYLLAVVMALMTVVGYRPGPTVPVQGGDAGQGELGLSAGFLRWALGQGMPTLGLVRPVAFVGLKSADLSAWLLETASPIVPGRALSILSASMPALGTGYSTVPPSPGSWPTVGAISPGKAPTSPDILQIGATPTVGIYETMSRDSFSWAVSEPVGGAALSPVSDKPADTVAAVGEALTRALAEQGVDAVHSSAVNDIQGMLGAYVRSAETAKSLLKDYPSVRYLIDVDRSPATVGTIEEGGVRASRVALVVGTSDLLPSPGWKKNLAFADRLAAALEYLHPGLLTSVVESPDRLNQEILPGGSLTVEIGGVTSSMKEEQASAKDLAEALASVVRGGAGGR